MIFSLAQIFLLTITILIMILVVVRYKQRKIDNRHFLFWLMLWVGATLIILFPYATFEVANFLGIGRGADLVLYLSIIVIFYLLFKLVVRLERIEREITLIVRKLALKEENK